MHSDFNVCLPHKTRTFVTSFKEVSFGESDHLRGTEESSSNSDAGTVRTVFYLFRLFMMYSGICMFSPFVQFAPHSLAHSGLERTQMSTIQRVAVCERASRVGLILLLIELMASWRTSNSPEAISRPGVASLNKEEL